MTSYTADGQPAEVQRSGGGITESYLYSYGTTPSTRGLLTNVTLRRQPTGGPWSTVRQVTYAYYDGSGTGGNLGDLQTATIQDGSGNVLDVWYYATTSPVRPTAMPAA